MARRVDMVSRVEHHHHHTSSLGENREKALHPGSRNKTINKTTGNHFNLPGHSFNNIRFTVIEKIKSNDKVYRKEKEKQFMNKFNTYYDGINDMP